MPEHFFSDIVVTEIVFFLDKIITDLAPADFHLFPKLKENLRGQHFESEEDIIAVTKSALKQLEIDAYVAAFDSWIRRWQKCLDNGGDYVE